MKSTIWTQHLKFRELKFSKQRLTKNPSAQGKIKLIVVKSISDQKLASSVNGSQLSSQLNYYVHVICWTELADQYTNMLEESKAALIEPKDLHGTIFLTSLNTKHLK